MRMRGGWYGVAGGTTGLAKYIICNMGAGRSGNRDKGPRDPTSQKVEWE